MEAVRKGVIYRDIVKLSQASARSSNDTKGETLVEYQPKLVFKFDFDLIIC